ncbi:MAG: hypothetical protein WC958_03945 [Dehalococcoidales bacterium]
MEKQGEFLNLHVKTLGCNNTVNHFINFFIGFIEIAIDITKKVT